MDTQGLPASATDHTSPLISWRSWRFLPHVACGPIPIERHSIKQFKLKTAAGIESALRRPEGGAVGR